MSNADLRIIIDGKEAKLMVCHNGEYVEYAPVIHAKWKLHKDGSGTCSQCNFTQRDVWDYDSHQRFCGVCGAKMDGE